MSELKRCPFCGSEAMLTNQLSADEYGHKLWNVVCFDCGNKTASYWDKEIVVEKWNTRKPIEKALKRLEERHKNHEKMLEHYRQIKDLDSAVKQSKMKCENEIAIEIIKEEVG